MMDIEKKKNIQKLILDALAIHSPVNENRLKSICDNCAFSVCREKIPYSVYSCFYPLVRAGLAECFIKDEQLFWTLVPAAVFYQDRDDIRSWLGINMSDDDRDQIPEEFECDDCDYVFFWKSDFSYTGEKLPIVKNPSALQLLKALPAYSVSYFKEEILGKITSFSPIYDPSNNQFVTIESSQRTNGFYKLTQEVYAPRLYHKNGKCYRLDKNNPDSENIAKVLHCIDNGIELGLYDREKSEIQFKRFLPIPFIISRILFLNQMFVEFEVNNDNRFVNITPEIYKELYRIFGERLLKK